MRTGTETINENKIKPVIAMEDYNTFENIRRILENNNFNVTLKYILNMGEVEFVENVANIVICGPKNSMTTKNTFKKFDTLQFIQDSKSKEWYFKDVKTKQKLTSPINNNTEQYAFLGKVESPKMKILDIYSFVEFML